MFKFKCDIISSEESFSAPDRHPIIQLSQILVDHHHGETSLSKRRSDFNKQIAFTLTIILHNLFDRKDHRIILSKNQKNYSREHIGNHIGKITLRSSLRVMNILKAHGMVVEFIGDKLKTIHTRMDMKNMDKGFMTTVILNPISKWDFTSLKSSCIDVIIEQCADEYSLNSPECEFICEEIQNIYRMFNEGDDTVNELAFDDVSINDYLATITATITPCIYRIKDSSKKIIEEIPVEGDKKAEIVQINNYIKMKGFPYSYQRIFGKNEHEGGRIYSWFQMEPKKERKAVLSELGLVEVDIKSLNPNIFYILETGSRYKENDGDVYASILKIFRLPNEYRKIIKKCMLSLFGCSSKKDAIKSIRFELTKNGLYAPKLVCYSSNPYDDEVHIDFDTDDRHIDDRKRKFIRNYLEKNDYSVGTKYKEIDPELLLLWFEKLHPEISKYFYIGISKYTQNIDSNAIIRVLHEMMRLNLDPLSIHDCIICPPEHAEDLEDYMYRCLFDAISDFKMKVLNGEIQDDLLHSLITRREPGESA